MLISLQLFIVRLTLLLKWFSLLTVLIIKHSKHMIGLFVTTSRYYSHWQPNIIHLQHYIYCINIFKKAPLPPLLPVWYGPSLVQSGESNAARTRLTRKEWVKLVAKAEDRCFTTVGEHTMISPPSLKWSKHSALYTLTVCWSIDTYR